MLNVRQDEIVALRQISGNFQFNISLNGNRPQTDLHGTGSVVEFLSTIVSRQIYRG